MVRFRVRVRVRVEDFRVRVLICPSAAPSTERVTLTVSRIL